ncbi:MAG: hypothetical protein HFG42_13965 [Lachnospiraceae bacterium]|jgi:hypothetical protein|nr:hypothetical protein [Lachnospiraceae bacterium]
MSRRQNGTNRARAAIGLSVYGPMNTGKRKRPKGVEAPVEAITKSINARIAESGGKING